MNYNRVIYDISRFTEYDVYLFKQGNHFALYEKMGSYVMEVNGRRGTYFAVWAPNAESVSVIGDFNGWYPDAHFLKAREDGSGIWEGFIPGIEIGSLYKYNIVSQYRDYRADKGDPYAFYWEIPPGTSSIVWDLSYEWNDC
jgi:1,4-alpha-glucan branching enzyme